MPRGFQLTTLDNGLRVITVPMAGVESTAIGMWVGVGTRYETKAQNGLSHLLEHMFLRGTESRSVRQIPHAVEKNGGTILPLTGHESTSFSGKVLGAHVEDAFNVIADMLLNSTFTESSLKRERGVVIQEINDSADAPAEQVYIRMMQQALPGNALNRPQIGTPKMVESLMREDIVNYVARHYTPDRMVLAAAGVTDHGELVDFANAAYGDMEPAPRIITPRKAVYKGGGARDEWNITQLNVCVGFKSVAETHPDAIVHDMISHILGGGMSSPLWQNIRARHGLVYDVSMASQRFSDAGIFAITSSMSPENAPRYLDELTKTLKTSIPKVSRKALKEAKIALNAQDTYAREDPETLANWAAECVLSEGKFFTVAERREQINAVTLDDLNRVHAEILSSTPTLAAVGRLEHLESYEEFAERFSDYRPRKKRAPSPA